MGTYLRWRLTVAREANKNGLSTISLVGTKNHPKGWDMKPLEPWQRKACFPSMLKHNGNNHCNLCTHEHYDLHATIHLRSSNYCLKPWQWQEQWKCDSWHEWNIIPNTHLSRGNALKLFNDLFKYNYWNEMLLKFHIFLA